MIRTASPVALPEGHRRPCQPASARIDPLRAFFALLALLLPAAVRAADLPADGIIVQVPTVITTESTNRLRAMLLGPLKRFEGGAARRGGRFTLLCDFNPEGRRAVCDDIGASYGLAAYLRSLPGEIKGVNTVAYVHGDVKRHSVLPVLACSEIVFAENGVLGPAAAGKPFSPVERTAYEEITRNRYPAVLIRKLYDPAVKVIRVGDHYAGSDEKPRPRGEVVDDLSGHEAVAYTFPLARKFGLCQQLPAASLEDVRVVYGLPRTGLHRSLDRTICWRIPVEGAVTGELVEQTRRRIQRACALTSTCSSSN